MTSNTVNPLASSASQALSGVPANMQINQSDFLRLITTQLKDQSPLNPANPNQFLQQIEGMSEVSSLQGMQSTLQHQQLTNGAALLGQSVLAPVSTATLAAGGSVTGAAQAPTGASQLTVTVADGSGNIVDAFNVAPQSSGLTSFTWNGKTSAGTAAPAGQYSVKVEASVAGSTQPVTPLIASAVTGITLNSSSKTLDVATNNGTVPLSSVASVL